MAGGLYTVRFRHYDPVWGRWISRDPLGYVDSMSLYAYAQASPVSFFDPFGLCSTPIDSPDEEEEPISSPVPPSPAPPSPAPPGGGGGGGSGKWDPLQDFLDARWGREVIEQILEWEKAALIEAAMWILPSGKIIQIGAKFVKVVKGGKVYTYAVEARKAPGADGARSLIIKEQVDGETISIIHQVIKDGKVIHQHQEHIGKYGTRRRFPDEWVEYPVINE